jgi:uncharacterized protein (TIGR02246 family)
VTLRLGCVQPDAVGIADPGYVRIIEEEHSPFVGQLKGGQMNPGNGSEERTPAEVSIAFAEAVSAGDLEGASGFFAEDARFLMADGQLIEGRAAIRKLLQVLLSNRPEMSVEIERVIETARGAVGSERWTMSFKGEGKERIEQSGRSTVVFARAGANWEILIDAPWGLAPQSAYGLTGRRG